MKNGSNILYYVTGNPSKFRLFSQFFPASSGITLKQCDYHLFEEQIEDQEAIAISKAKQAWDHLQKPLIVDEVGAYFNQYTNFPGAFTKFVYKGLGVQGINKLINAGDPMTMLIHVVYIWGPDQYKVFTVRSPGVFKKLSPADMHDPHAPFDAIFMPEGCDKSYTELEKFPELYAKTFYRAIVARQIIEYINSGN